jgi:hypothetical protein
MEKYKRKESKFSLCGLNCCLCPRYNTEGLSKCPGCGDENFEEQHPTCAVITCNKKHDAVEYCFQCSQYRCKRYEGLGKKDSFISYRRIQENLESAQRNIDSYINELRIRKQILNVLLEKYNDGKRKGLYCLATNDLPLILLENIMKQISNDEEMKVLDDKEKIKKVSELIKTKGLEEGIELKLRK